MKISRYVHVTEKDESMFVTSLLTRTVLEVSADIWQKISQQIGQKEKLVDSVGAELSNLPYF